MKTKTIKAFNILVLFTFIVCVLLALRSYQARKCDSLLIFGVMTGFSVIAACVVGSLEKLFRMMTRRSYFVTTAILTLGLLACQIITVRLTELKLINDLDYIVTGVKNFLGNRWLYEGIIPLHNDYFESYTNNHFLTIILIALYKISISLTGTTSETIPIAVNVAGLALSYWLLCMCAIEIHDTPKAMVCAVRGLMFTPFITYTSIFYTDTMSIPFIMLALFFYLRFRRSRKLYTMVICGALVGMAYKMKGSSMVLVAAVAIDMLYSKPKVKEFIAFFAPFAVVCKVISAVSLRILAITKEQLYDKEFPFIHWVMMGADGRGDYILDDFKFTQSIPGRSEKAAADLERLKDKLSDQGFRGFLHHIKEKIQFTWDNPPFMVSKYYNGDFRSDAFKMIAFVCYFTLLFSIAHSLYRSARRKPVLDVTEDGEVPDSALVPRLCLMGLTVFLLLWETRCRYLISFFPIFMLI